MDCVNLGLRLGPAMKGGKIRRSYMEKVDFDIPEDAGENLRKNLFLMKNPSSPQDQVSAVQEVTSNVKNTKEVKLLTKILVETLLQLQPKAQLRNKVLKCLSSLIKDYTQIVTEVLQQTLLCQLQHSEICTRLLGILMMFTEDRDELFGLSVKGEVEENRKAHSSLKGLMCNLDLPICQACLHVFRTEHQKLRESCSSVEISSSIQALQNITKKTSLYILYRKTFKDHMLTVNEEIVSMGDNTMGILLEEAKDIIWGGKCPLDLQINCAQLAMITYVALGKGNLAQYVQSTFSDDYSLHSQLCQLSLLNGVLCYGSAGELCKEVINGTTVAVCILETALASAALNEDARLALSCSRVVHQWVLKMMHLFQGSQAEEDIKALVHPESAHIQKLLQHLWIAWDHYLDNVKHLAKEIFQNYIKIQQTVTVGYKSYFEQMGIMFLHQLSSKSFIYKVLSCLVKVLGTGWIFKNSTKLVPDLLERLSDPALASCSAELLETLFTQNYKEIDSKKWQEFWLPTFLSCYSEEMQTYGYELLFCKLLSCCPDAAPAAVNLLVGGKSLTDQGMCLLFMTVKICRKIWAKSGQTQNFAAFEKNSVKLWKDIFPYNILEQGLFHKEESISDAAFALICESPRSTELFDKEELQLVLDYLKVSICSQSPAYRQHLLKNVKKLMQRFDCGLTTLKKSLKTKKNYSAEAHEVLINHFMFCETLCHALFSNLHSGANFPRRGTSLQILEMLFTIVLSNHDDIITAEKCPQSWANSLIWTLNDSYENNKSIALQLLTMLPQKDLEIISPAMAKALLEAVCQLASSCRPPDSATASFLLQLLLFSSSSQAILKEKIGVGPNKWDKELTGCHYALHCLQKEVKIASSQLIRAAACGPMYGWLTCLRSLLALYIKEKSQEDVDGWRSVIKEVIHTSFELTDIVAPVVKNSSPEGHLPMDLNLDSLSAMQLLLQSCLAQQATTNNTIELTKEVSSDELVKAQAVSAQMLLLCAWRSVKEVSLMLGDMVLSAPIGNSPNSLLSVDQVTTIGKYFLTQLSETKHRGAFEQTYVGFGKVCERLWRCEDSQLRELPEVWLDEVLEAIQDPQNPQLCSTRRSAGVPFIIQAVLSTEPPVRGSISLNKTMALLLSLASHPDYDNSEARVHAFNILRALYRDTILGDRIVPHVASGVKAALRGYTSKTWGERNAATLLFTALITRMLGVKKTQDDLNYRNAMSALVFFKRYPELNDFLLQQLQSCVDVVESSLTPSVYPVLLLLARLAPPPLEGRTGGLCLTPFMPTVLQCSKSPIWQLRVLASKALCPLVTQKQLPQVFKQLCSELTHTCQNSLHGFLLCLIELLRTNISCIKKSLDLQQDVISSLMDIVWIATASNSCLVTRGCAIELFLFLLDHKLLQWTDSVLAPIVRAASELLSSSSEGMKHIPGSTQCLLVSSRFIFSCELSKGVLTSSSFFPLLLESQFYEVKEMTLEHLLKAPNLPENVYIKLLKKVEGEETHAGCLATMCKVIIRQLQLCDYEGPDQVYRLLPVVLDRLQQETKLDNIESFLLLSGAIVAALLKRDGWCDSQLELWCKIVVSMTSSEQSDDIRLVAADVILYTAPYLLDSKSSPESLSLCLLEGLAVLLQDDDSLVRSKAARAAAIVCAEEKYKTQEAARLITPLCMAIANQRKDSPAVLTLFIVLTLREEVPEGFGLAQDDDRVFDKGEMNVFGEEMIMAEASCTALARALHHCSSPHFLLHNIKLHLLMPHTKCNPEIHCTNQVSQEEQREVLIRKDVLIQKCAEELEESDKVSLEEMVEILHEEIEMICFQVEDMKTKLPLQVRHFDIWLVRLACRAKLLAVLRSHTRISKSISSEAKEILEANLIKNVFYDQVLQDIKC